MWVGIAILTAAVLGLPSVTAHPIHTPHDAPDSPDVPATGEPPCWSGSPVDLVVNEALCVADFGLAVLSWLTNIGADRACWAAHVVTSDVGDENDYDGGCIG